MPGTLEIAVVAAVFTVCTFIVTFWLGHVDRLWKQFAREKRNLMENRNLPSPHYFDSLSGLARQSQIMIGFGGVLVISCFVWMSWLLWGFPTVDLHFPQTIALLAALFVWLAVRVWWREFNFARRAFAAEKRDLETRIQGAQNTGDSSSR